MSSRLLVFIKGISDNEALDVLASDDVPNFATCLHYVTLNTDVSCLQLYCLHGLSY